MATCEHDGNTQFAPDNVIENLPDCQAKEGRHKCPICAYNEGVAVKNGKEYGGLAGTCSHDITVPRDMLKGLPDNQGGTGRHKCVYTAYQDGLNS